MIRNKTAEPSGRVLYRVAIEQRNFTRRAARKADSLGVSLIGFVRHLYECVYVRRYFVSGSDKQALCAPLIVYFGLRRVMCFR